MVNYFFVIIKVIYDFEREYQWQNVRIAEKQQLSGTTAAFQCVPQAENLNQISRRFLSMKTGER